MKSAAKITKIFNICKYFENFLKIYLNFTFVNIQFYQQVINICITL